jgi:STE24 endopeptidase
MGTVILDTERQKSAKKYARIRIRLMLVDLVIAGIYTIAWLAFGWAISLKDSLARITSSDWILVALFGIVFGGSSLILNLPMAYYQEYVLPHQFGTSNQTIQGWISDQVKGILIGGILGGVILEIIYAILRIAPDTWWIWASAILILFSVLLANLAPVILMPLFNKYVPLGEEHADLANRLVRLAERSKTSIQGVYQFDLSRRTKAANAALTGLGRTRRIILGDTLINEFSPDEIETVLAHELGHQVNHDIPLSILFQSVMTIVMLYLASLGLTWGVRFFGFQGPADIASLPVLFLIVGIYSLITMPLGNGFTRWRERKADEYAIRTTRNGPAFASAMTRLANQNLSEIDPDPLEEFLLFSHPALKKRIQMAEQELDAR